MSITDDVKRGIKQLRIIEDRFLNGDLDPVAARPALQRLIEDRSTSLLITTPSWYTSADAQIEKASVFLELYGGQEEGFRVSDIPAIPTNFIPRTKTEVLLLAVYLPDWREEKGFRRTFDNWWDFISRSADVIKRRAEVLEAKCLRLAPGIEYEPGIRWVAFDPNTYQGISPRDALTRSAAVDGTTLAHAEVLMAAAMFPGWMFSFNGDKSPCPNMSALWFYLATVWSSSSPRLDCWFDGGRILRLFVGRSDATSWHWSSPSVRVVEY